MNATKADRLVSMLKQVVPSGDISELRDIHHEEVMGVESVGGSSETAELFTESIKSGVKAIENDDQIQADEQYALEAIVMPKYRPVVDIIKDSFGKPGDPWEHFGRGTIRSNIEKTLRSIGRIELPEHPTIPYGGTGFVVGKDLIMTNRHVAEIFASGLGTRQLVFKQGVSSGIDFVQEIKPRDSQMLEVKQIVMIHPHWDMALLRVKGLDPDHPILRLGVTPSDELTDREIAVVGYPAQDPRNDFKLQMDIFRQQFNVKRMQPGKLRAPEEIVDSFKNRVRPLLHDASTLGGNSGSAVIDVKSGEVVGLHFGGKYLVANYCVPTYELARDSRVVAQGLNFTDKVRPTSEWDKAWIGIEQPGSIDTPKPTPIDASGISTTVNVGSGRIGFSIPLHISISLGGDGSIPSLDVTEKMMPPIVAPRLGTRGGFKPNHLDLDDDVEIVLPKLTSAGKEIVAKTSNGSPELKYHHFSVVMHKERRMAIFTASNVDWREKMRTPSGRKPSRKELTGLGPNDFEQWITDPRIPEEHQLPDVFYTNDRASFDKGHLVRRDDVCWGKTFEDIQKANGDTYHTTNCSPQVKGFNQSAQGEDNWGDLENLVQKETKAEKAIVFAGPVFGDDDPIFKGKDKHGDVEIPIPQSYWKIIVTKGPEGPQAFGFVLEQDLSGVTWEMAVPKAWRKYMKPIEHIEELLGGLARFVHLATYDQYNTDDGESVSRRLAKRGST